jgi:hypothetical protein
VGGIAGDDLAGKVHRVEQVFDLGDLGGVVRYRDLVDDHLLTV